MRVRRSAPVDTVRALCAGAAPESLGLPRLPDGYVDLRGIRIPRPRPAAKRTVAFGVPVGSGVREHRGVIEHILDRPIFEGCQLRRIDFTKSVLGGSVWKGIHLEEVRFDHVDARDVVFRSGTLDRPSFRGADLRESHWGSRQKPGPEVLDADFAEADWRGSTFGFPRFVRCLFVNANLGGVDFFGAQFEHCVFEGVLDNVWFHGRYTSEHPETASLRNTMEGVDFSRAELRSVSFSDGIDLTRSLFPTEGYLRIPHPKASYTRALSTIKASLSGRAREHASFYLENMLKHFREEQPFDIFRPRDLLESPLGQEVASAILKALEEAARSAE